MLPPDSLYYKLPASSICETDSFHLQLFFCITKTGIRRFTTFIFEIPIFRTMLSQSFQSYTKLASKAEWYTLCRFALQNRLLGEAPNPPEQLRVGAGCAFPWNASHRPLAYGMGGALAPLKNKKDSTVEMCITDHSAMENAVHSPWKSKKNFPTACKQRFPQLHEMAGYTHSHCAERLLNPSLSFLS